MRVMLAVAVAFALAFPLSAGASSSACTPGAQATCAKVVNSDFSAARRHRAPSRIMCPISPPLTREVCLCEVSGGHPVIYNFPIGTPRVMCWAGGLHL